ncbi:AI-2E family transporter [Janthinobacterium sp.]|uniref:AI-2E family transporter n=1 Tax=Janthinobacterium sp. TaxID=1871054 RepID=UPI00293D2046|nr:AI-2E family transporter [Janthinobacterium sp.]
MPLPIDPPNRADNDSTADAVLTAAASVDAALPLLNPDAVEPAASPFTTVNVRSVALVVIATLGSLYVLHWAGEVFVPLLMGLMLSYALTPVVNRMVRWHLPRALAAAVVLVSIVSAVGSVLYHLRDDAVAMIESMPEAAQKLRRGLEGQRSQGTAAAIGKVQKAAAEIERATESEAAPAASRGVTKVQIERGRFNVKDYLWPSAMGLASASGRIVVVVFIAFFLLASGDTFRRKMVRIAGPTFSQKKLTLQALDEVDQQIQRYLGVQVITSLLVGVATWLAFLWIGVERAAVWGFAGFVLNFIPYFGSIVVTGGSALMGLVQFNTFEMALLVGGVSLAIHSIEGYILTPWMTSRASRMNAVAVFVGVLAWGWLWGIAGLFLGVPIMMAIKAVCDRVDDLKAVGELLGD